MELSRTIRKNSVQRARCRQSEARIYPRGGTSLGVSERMTSMKALTVAAILSCTLCIGCGYSAEEKIAIENLKQKIQATESELMKHRSELAVQQAKYRVAHNSGHRSSEQASAVLGEDTQEEILERVKKQESLIEELEQELARDMELLAEIE